MRNRISLRRCSLWLVLALSVSTSVSAQEGEDHAAHHGGDTGTASMPTGGAMSAPAAPGSTDMAKMMDSMMERMINGEGA